MKTYEVVRQGKCITCGQEGETYLGEFEAVNKLDAIHKAIEVWNYDNFGESGAMKEQDIAKEKEFLHAHFVAKIINK